MSDHIRDDYYDESEQEGLMNSSVTTNRYLERISLLMNSHLYEQCCTMNKKKSQELSDANRNDNDIIIEKHEKQQFFQDLIQCLEEFSDQITMQREQAQNEKEMKKQKILQIIEACEEEEQQEELKNIQLNEIIQRQDEVNAELAASLAKKELSNFQSAITLQSLEEELKWRLEELEREKNQARAQHVDNQRQIRKKEQAEFRRQRSEQVKFEHELAEQLMILTSANEIETDRLTRLQRQNEHVQAKNNHVQSHIDLILGQRNSLKKANLVLGRQRNGLQQKVSSSSKKKQQQNSGKSNRNNENDSEIETTQQPSQQSFEHLMKSLADEIGDQFNDTMFSPISTRTMKENNNKFR